MSININYSDDDASSPAYSPKTPKIINRRLNSKLNTPIGKVFAKKRHSMSEKCKNKDNLLKSTTKKLSTIDKIKKRPELRKSCSESCRMKCSQRISEEIRQQIFEKFYKDYGHNRKNQWSYIASLIMLCKKKVCKNIEHSRKTESRKYNLCYEKDGKEIKESVCKPMFLNTLAITHQTIETAIQKANPNSRSKAIVKKSIIGEISNEIKTIILQHIHEFPLEDVHYCQQKAQSKYIAGEISSISHMYKLYESWFRENGHDKNLKASLKQYRYIFQKSTNTLVYMPQIDVLCNFCETYKNSNDHARTQMESKYNHHMYCKQKARELKNLDKQEAFDKKNIITAYFDFQNVLSSPYADVDRFYYKRKLHTYTFSIFELTSECASCFVWDETIAKEGAIEVATCLYRFIMAQNRLNVVDTFNFWSDNCCGRNKNKIVFAFYIWIVRKLNNSIIINHKFLEKGHTQNEGDCINAYIEKFKHNKHIYSPMEWFFVIRNAKKTEPRFEVFEMQQSDFLDFSQFVKITNWAKNTDCEKFDISKVRQIKVCSEHKNSLLYKYEFDGDFKTLIVYDEYKTMKTANLRKRIENIPKAYKTKFNVTERKRNDLVDLCDQNLIPKFYQKFYRNLSSGGGAAAEKDYIVMSDTEN